MNPRVIILISTILTVMIFSPTVMATSWENGQGWGYEWVIGSIDFGENYTFNGTTDGKNVLGVYIQYEGDENGLYNFSYFGSLYEYNFINGTLEKKNYPFERVWIDYRTHRWVNFDGYFIMERCNITDMWSKVHQVYAIKSQFIHVYTKEGMERSGSGYVKLRDQIENYSMNYTVNFDIRLMLNYSQPLAYFPLDDDEMIYYSTLSYNGHVRADGHGYFKYGELMRTIDMNRTVDENVNSSVQITVKFSSNNEHAQRAGVIELIPIYFTWAPRLIFDNLGFYMSLVLTKIGQITPEAKIENDFYSSITIPGMIIGGYKHLSESASEKDIEDIQNKAPEIYGPSEGGVINNYLIIGAILTVSVVIVVIAILFKKSHKGTT